MRILTWNIHGIPFSNKTARYPLIRNAVDHYKPDIFLFQEIFFPFDNSFVNSFDGYDIANREIVRSSGLAAGIGVESKLEYEVKDFSFDNQGSLLKIGQFGDRFVRKGFQELDLGSLVVINTHLVWSHFNDDRVDRYVLSQTRQLLKHVRKRKQEGRKIIVAGDFNFRPDSEAYKEFREELRDLTADLPVRVRDYDKVDYVFGDFRKIKAEYVFHPSFRGSYPSDHQGICVDFKL